MIRATGIAGVLCSLAFGAAARAQSSAPEPAPIWTQTVQVTFQGCTNVPETVTVVLDNDELNPFDLTRVPGRQLWVTEDGRRVNARRPHTASARLEAPPRRTYCAKGYRVPHYRDPNNLWALQFRLSCRAERIWPALSVTPVEPLEVSYVRLLPAENIENGVPCAERGLTGEEIGFIAARHESIFLHVGEPVPRSYMNYAVLLDPGLKAGKRDITAQGITLDRQRVRENFGMRGGRNAPNALQIFDRYHLDAGFKKLTLRSVP